MTGLGTGFAAFLAFVTTCIAGGSGYAGSQRVTSSAVSQRANPLAKTQQAPNAECDSPIDPPSDLHARYS